MASTREASTQDPAFERRGTATAAPPSIVYADAAAWVLMVGGLGLAVSWGFSLGPAWLGLLAGAVPAYLLAAILYVVDA